MQYLQDQRKISDLTSIDSSESNPQIVEEKEKINYDAEISEKKIISEYLKVNASHHAKGKKAEIQALVLLLKRFAT
ncbi:hypothetical protein CEXT_785841 [Caerostris extrusa]|uniref:Uncharacterized protein n=1 Tax=Caerostris extrusa TaxID=172846 RepID=A0AAV4TS64_CAEEX|nr:hypothetical protein CEXT_785841 [Caerostris extrusa]